MNINLVPITIAIILLPLLGSLIAGLLGKQLGKRVTHTMTISLVGIAFVLSCYLFQQMVLLGKPAINTILYTWVNSGLFTFDIALLIDRLSATMVLIVTFISFMVHIYTIGYMAEDPGYQRFFSYVSLFTFAMLVLVLANNFLLMFFGWEGVGLVSYLLIGFWFKRESAVVGSLKAFLVNRVGDIGFILGTAAVLMFFDSLDYQTVFSQVHTVIDKKLTLFPGVEFSAITVICLLLFIGAMGKSAQIPLHVWLPESMEGPTPISALIHAATMVTAGIYMVARLSPLFEHSVVVLSIILVIGATTCLFMGILAIFHHDIKRVIAYSTLSQLGYMTAALGASAYDAAIFHLVTHAFFKALLFLAAGSVIIALHHEQDMRKMGGLSAYMPITCLTFWVGALAVAAIPPFSGFYSKDIIIESVKLSTIPGATYAYICVLIGAFLTPLYIFRATFLTFHGRERFDPKIKEHLHESPWVILLPLVLLAVPSMIVGGMLIYPMFFATPRLLGDSIFVLSAHNILPELSAHFHGATQMALLAGSTYTFWLALAGIATAVWLTTRSEKFFSTVKKRFAWLNFIIVHKYGFDDFNRIVFVDGTLKLGRFLYYISDLKLIDGIFVNGSGRLIRWFSQVSRRVQTGYLYHYAFSMIIGLAVFLGWILLMR